MLKKASKTKIALFFCLALSPAMALGQNNQEGDLNTATINSTVDSNNNTTNNSKTFNGAGSSSDMPVASSISPSLMSSGNDTCLKSQSGGLQLVLLGASAGRYVQDEECNRRKDAKVLKEMGMAIAAVSLMCQDINVWRAMFNANTPCPIVSNGKLVVGRAAILALRQNPEVFIPDYLERKKFYNSVLNIGAEIDDQEDTAASISERFRTSSRD